MHVILRDNSFTCHLPEGKTEAVAKYALMNAAVLLNICKHEIKLFFAEKLNMLTSFVCLTVLFTSEEIAFYFSLHKNIFRQIRQNTTAAY